MLEYMRLLALLVVSLLSLICLPLMAANFYCWGVAICLYSICGSVFIVELALLALYALMTVKVSVVSYWLKWFCCTFHSDFLVEDGLLLYAVAALLL